MRVLFASSLLAGAILVVAACSDYSSDEPAGPEGDGGASSGSSGSGDGGPRADGSVIPGAPITVTGKIISFGVAMPNVPVVVGGKTTVNTSTLGTFTVEGVQPPYDVAFALKTNDAQPRITVYQGLTRPDPTLIALGTGGELRPNATTIPSLTGTVGGANGPGWARTPIVAFTGPNRGYGFANVDTATGSYTMQGTDGPLWYGATGITGTLHASLVLDNENPMKAYHAKLDNVALTSGTAVTGKDIELEQVEVGILETDITAPGSFSEPNKAVVNMGTRYDGSAGFFLKSTIAAFPHNLKRAVPLVAGAAFQVSVGYAPGGDSLACFARATTTAAANGKLTLALVEPPAHLEPAEDATGVAPTSPFTFSAFPNGIHRFTLVATNQPTVTIVTAATSVTLPDLTPFAVTIPKGAAYTWRVAGFRPVAGLDDDVMPTILAAIDGNLPSVDQCEISISSARKLTFAP